MSLKPPQAENAHGAFFFVYPQLILSMAVRLFCFFHSVRCLDFFPEQIQLHGGFVVQGF